MVDQSFLPFRLLARRYGAQLCYTPMINANQFTKSANFRRDVLNDLGHSEDRPLIAQFAGHDAATLLDAAKHVEGLVDAMDLNLGCPQHIARRGRYGAYLLEEEDLVVEIVRTLSSNLTIPVTCKIRLFRGQLGRTISLCQRLEDAGCSMLTVHGRTRYQNKQTVGSCDFASIAAVKAAVKIPVVANGGIAVFEDVGRCLQATGANGVMSSEAALENPALFCMNRDAQGQYVDQDRLACEYLDLAEQYLAADQRVAKECPKCVKAHLFKILHAGLQRHHDLRDWVGRARSLQEYRDVARELEARGWEQPMFHTCSYSVEQSWYFRHRLGERESVQQVSCKEHVDQVDEDAPWAQGLFEGAS